MKVVFVLSMLTLLSGCYVYDRPVVPARIYTAAEVDAINAENECRRLARNTLQSARCGPNERR
jgi:hypothetical protein